MRLFFTSVMLLFTLVGLSQAKYEINGSVIDSTTQKPLEFVKVVALTVSDSSVVKGAYTNATGNYTLTGLKAGNYLLQFTAFEYDAKYLTVNLESKRLNLAPFALVKADYILKEGVDIIYETKVLETSIDKKVYDPSQDLSTQAGTVSEMLNNVPSIEVDQDGNISLRGNQNVTILIDGLPSNLTADNLSSLPASSIERVEIVTNPSAKYDPDGTAGIINLVLKKNKLRGMNGTVNASAASGNQYNLNVSVNARTEKVNVFASYGLRYYEGYRNHYSDWYRDLGDTNSYLRQERRGTDLNVNHTARFGVDYTLNERQTLSFSATGNAGVRDRYGNQFNYQYFNDDLDYYWNREAYDPRDRSSLDLRMNYRYKFKEDGGDLKVAANQSWGQSDNSGEYIQQYYTDEDVAIGQATYQNIDNLSENSLSTLALDVTRNLKKKRKIEYGSKFILNTNDKTAYSESFDTVSMLFTPDTNINNQFVVNQNVFSAYGIYGQQL
ncbi:outer membrane beta-barrel protein, partial [Lishizhenia sp.]|uniref:outer membrane beta-barrel protein n=1 Tax=Lishizhenia sp. TaxID=2497594 RepID=UPI00299E1C0A